jgi:hypothetical protein
MTLEDVLKEVAAYTDQEATTPTGTDYTTRLNYANRSLNEWSEFDDWDELISSYEFSVTGTSGISYALALPTLFKKPMSPLAVYNASVPTMYEIIPNDERFLISSSKNYCYLSGDGLQGYTLNVPKGLASGCSAIMDIQSFPTSLLSLCSVLPMKNSDFVVQRIISLVLESRGDDRFPIAKADADRKLAGMSEAQNAKNIGMNNKISTPETFIIGYD